MKPLSALFNEHGSDKCRFDLDLTGHSYGVPYDRLLTPRRESLTAVLEVGVCGGASLRAWREWLPESCRVVGIDNNLTCGPIPGVELYQCDSMDAAALENVLGGGTFDLVVDDGGHALHEQTPTFDNLFPRVRAGGLYIVEDLQSIAAQEYFLGLGAEIVNNNARTGKWDDVLAVIHRPKG